MMRFPARWPVLAVSMMMGTAYWAAPVSAQVDAYRRVAQWPLMPPGMYFGLQDGWPDQAARDAAAAQRQAGGMEAGPPPRPSAPPIYGQGVSGIAIDDQDQIHVFNRGVQTVMVFDRDGRFMKAGGERDGSGQPIAGGWLHSGEVDWNGNVWVVERDNHRILKLDPTLERVLMQLGTTGEPGNGPDHLDRPSGISVLRSGRLVVTDGYGNNRVVMYSADGAFIKQVARGAGGPEDAGTGPGEFDLPHQAAVDANDSIFVIDRENRRLQVFDSELEYVREITNEGWYPWDIAISRAGDDRLAYVADHATEQVRKISLDDGRILATWGAPGRGPGQFDWVHGMAVDPEGAVYAADTYGQRVQKFVPAGGRE